MRRKKEYYEYPLRVCQTLHSCCVCIRSIFAGELYYDGGYRRRCHERCAPPEVKKEKEYGDQNHGSDKERA